MRNGKIDPGIFWPGLIVLSILLSSLVFVPNTEQTINSLLSFITFKFDWLFLLVTFSGFIFLLWLAFGPYGTIRFGGKEQKPEFSTFSWITMLFCAGIGSALIYWAIIEPLYYLNGPPFGLEPNTKEAAGWSIAYGFFHWGFSAWGIYAIPAVVLSYSLYNRKNYALRPSAACRGVLGDMVDGWVGKLIDITIMFGLIGGVGTTLGVNVPMISAVVGEIFGVSRSFWVDFGVIVIWTSLFGASAYLGLQKGIKILSDLNAVLALLLAVFILIVGPTSLILSNFSNSLGVMLQNFLQMSFGTDPFMQSGFPQNWTVFYWAWWFAYSVYMGIFVARISKGRTIKELIIAMVMWGSLGCFLFFAIFGTYVLDLDLNGIIPLSRMLQENNDTGVIVAMLNSLPMRSVLLPFFVVVSLIFQATTLDSAAYTLAAITTKREFGDEEPARWNRVLWSAVLGVLAIVLLAIGGLKVVQLSSVVVGVPVILVLVLFILSFMKWLKEETI